MRIAKLPNGETLQVPEGTSDATMDAAVRRFINGNSITPVFFPGDKGEKGDQEEQEEEEEEEKRREKRKG